MTDFLDEKRKEIDARLKELKPLVDEYARLEKAAAALAGVTTHRRRRTAPHLGPPASGTAGAVARAAAASAALQAQELVAASPGVTIPELADAMGIQANYLYRVMPTLQKEGKVRKQGKGWHPA